MSAEHTHSDQSKRAWVLHFCDDRQTGSSRLNARVRGPVVWADEEPIPVVPASELDRLEERLQIMKRALGWATRSNWIPTPAEVELARHALTNSGESR